MTELSAPGAAGRLSDAFGGSLVRPVYGTGRSTPQQDMDWSLRALADVRPGGEGLLRVHCPRPTAAFSRRDSLTPGFAAASTAAAALGFDPVVRPAGGRLAAYHTGGLVLDLVAPHPEPRTGHRERFAAVADCVVDALRTLGVDARPGPVPGEYCPGEYSVNARGKTKLVGTAQRITRHGYLFGTVVLVRDPEPVRKVLAATYPLLGLDWDPATVGSVADEVPGFAVADVADVVVAAMLGLLSAG